MSWRRPTKSPGAEWPTSQTANPDFSGPYVTARHVLANHQRRLRRRHELSSRLADQLRSVPLRVDPPDEYHHLMQNCLQDLAPDDREVLMLAGWEGLSATEIGHMLGALRQLLAFGSTGPEPD